MSRFTEKLNLGVWTAPDPAVLEPGQLSDARNCYYLPGTQALVRARGRAVFGTVTAAASAVQGLRDITFDNSDHYVVAMLPDRYRYSSVGDAGSGSFTTLTTFTGTPSRLEAVHYRNRFFLLSGNATSVTATPNTNTVAYLSATAVSTPLSSRQHGMIAVTASPNVTAVAAPFSQAVTGYYEYWTTEVAKITTDGTMDFQLESTFAGTPTTVFVSSTGMAPVIHAPGFMNSITTHWRVYRSTKKGSESEKRFPTGFLISTDLTVSATSVNDSTTSVTASAFPASMNGVGDGATFYAGWSNAVRLSADDNSDASVTGTGIFNPFSQGVYGFNLGGFSGPVKGIEVQLEAFSTGGAAALGVTIGRNRQSNGDFAPPGVVGVSRELLLKNNTAAKSIGLSTTRTAYTLGGATDRWLPADKPGFGDTDFGPNFMVLINAAAAAGVTVSVDYVKLKVYSASTIDSVLPFPTVVYNFGDVSAQVGKNGAPPSSSTGDMYEESLVVNDLASPGLVRFSYPGDPESFPATYYVSFDENRDNDSITAIRVVNNRLIVGLKGSIWRMNYLPSERDASFDRGKCKEPISRSYGVVNEMCICNFSPDGGTELCAFVSLQGIHATDGFSFDTYTEGVDWRDQIFPTGSTTSPIALINDAERQLLLFYFRNDGNGQESYLCLPLSYGQGHWNGKPKVGGLVHLRNRVSSQNGDLESAWPVRRSSGTTDVYLGYSGATAAGAGQVYIETGSTIPASAAGMSYTTRRIYLAGEGNEFKTNELYGYGAVTGTQGWDYQLLNVKTNATGEAAGPTKSKSLAGERMWKVSPSFMAEGLRIAASCTAGHDDTRKEFLILEGDGFGMEDSGK